ncbi:MAG: hypothetical protein GEV08_17600, partial [Acidimicrobiia bacterium]|nr:hypothetical protein [Acidimicrobiia bacterium]
MTEDPAARTTTRESGTPPAVGTGGGPVSTWDEPAAEVAAAPAEAAGASEGPPAEGPAAQPPETAEVAEEPGDEAAEGPADAPAAAEDRGADGDAAGNAAADAENAVVASAEQVEGSRARLLRLAVGAAQVLALWVLTWPSAALSAAPSLDPSFRWGLQQAFVEGRRFGTEIVFTYGPLGFLSFPELYFTLPTFLSIAARSVLMFAGCGFVLWAVRRVVPNRVVAFLVAYGLVALTLTPLVAYLPETICALLVSGSLAVVLGGELGSRRRVTVLVGIGATAALLALMKLNTGVTAGLVGSLAAVSLASGRAWRPLARLRDLATFLLAGLATFLLGWLVSRCCKS